MWDERQGSSRARGVCCSVNGHGSVNLSRPGIDATAQVHKIGHALRREKLRDMHAARTVMTDHHKLALALHRADIVDSRRNARHGNIGGARDLRRCEFPRLAHIEQRERTTRLDRLGKIRGVDLRNHLEHESGRFCGVDERRNDCFEQGSLNERFTDAARNLRMHHRRFANDGEYFAAFVQLREYFVGNHFH